jgi:hypothetical protein
VPGARSTLDFPSPDRARKAIDVALDAMNSLDGWPQERDYE